MDNNYSLDLSSIPRELKLLLEIMRMENADRDALFKNELFTDIDWELFLQLSRHHRIYPVIYSKLKKMDHNRIPSHVVQTLYQEYKKNTFKMLTLCGEMEQVSKLFTENQIRLLFLKGPVIAADIYGDISLRTSKDLDILIPITNLENAEKLLLSLGYEKERLLNVLNDWKWRNNHVVYFHPQKGIQLEIHWRLDARPSKEPTFNELWERKRVSSITNSPVYFLGKEDLFLFLVSHGARHGWFRLRWLLDIDQMLRKGFDLEKENILLNKYQSRYTSGQALILASELLETPIEGDLKKLTEENVSKKLAQNVIEFIKGTDLVPINTSTKYYQSYLFSLKSGLQKFLYILLLFYPSSSDVKTLKLPKPLHFLYFPLRPFLMIGRKIRKLV